VSERERPDPDPDIEFDFFEEGPTREAARDEAQTRRVRIPTRRPGGPGPPQPPRAGPKPGLYRLAILIGGAILLAVILVLWVNSCRQDAKRDAYQDYMEDVTAIGTESEQIGRQLSTVITTPGIQITELERRLDGLRMQQSQVLTRAQGLDPPGPLIPQQDSLEESLQFRVSGLAGLAQAFGRIEQTDAQEAGSVLAGQAARLIASDVVWEDLFKAGAQDVLQREEVSGVAVPDSNFLTTPELASPASWTPFVDRLTQPQGQAGGLHGNQIAGVRVLPGGETLSPTEENTVTASDRLAFEVLIQNSGDFQETQVRVTLTIQQQPQPIRKQEMIEFINPGETKSVTFRDLGQPAFSTPTTLRVAVRPVAGETNTNNNTAEYRVIFALG
jgi:hypothetical protein